MGQSTATILNRMNADSQRCGLGTYGLVCVPISITSDASSGQSVTIPFDMYLIDVIVQATATSTSGTVQLRKATTAITNAIAMATDNTIARAGTIDDTRSTLLTTDSLNVLTNGSGDRGIVVLIGYRA